MNLRTLIFSFIFGLVALSLGVGLGILYQGQKKPVQIQVPTVQTTPDSIKVLSSSLIPSITARGKVTKIDGMNITLVFQPDSRVITMRSDANILALISAPVTPTNKSKYTNKQVAFGDIKVGDNVDINIRVLPNGQIEGVGLVILPTPDVAPAPVTK